jgi:carotenoid 1,2-hydratase
MKIESNYLSDIPVKKGEPGSYEWWYFDGEDHKGDYRFVIIFYEGCPFSPDYIRSSEKHPEHVGSRAEEHPAVSISVYKDGKTVFYSLSEYAKSEAIFNRDRISLRVGKNSLEGFVENDQMVYALRMEEVLPTGEKFSGILRFSSTIIPTGLLNASNGSDTAHNHSWNLVQPKAFVKGVISINQKNRHEKPIIFEGNGYHDHNLGLEPMRNQFDEWYWGRVHFSDLTLVYYYSVQKGTHHPKAWLIGPDNSTIVDETTDITIDGNKMNSFFLSAARRIIIKFNGRKIQLNVDEVLDSGPFYFRFMNVVRLTSDVEGESELTSGISEYIRPERIRKRLFWPLVRMRFRYTSKRPHWVQRSSILYRWTL